MCNYLILKNLVGPISWVFLVCLTPLKIVTQPPLVHHEGYYR